MLDVWVQLCTGRLRRDERGAIAIVLSVALPILVLISGFVIDYALSLSQKTRLQAAVDAAALAAARELSFADVQTDHLKELTSKVVTRHLAATPATQRWNNELHLEAVRPEGKQEVQVVASQAAAGLFGRWFGLAGHVLRVEAVARVMGDPNVCVLALDPTAVGAISLVGQARITGENCGFFVNSNDQNAIMASGAAVAKATMICAVGGRSGDSSNFDPDVITDCPAFADPLAARPEPTPGPCSHNNLIIDGGSHTLFPGTYCGGLKIKGAASVTLAPGVYAILDGELRVDDDASLTAEEAGFFLKGAGAEINFGRKSSISLSGPRSGPLAGLLFFESRSQSKTTTHRILSNDARTLVGTIYLSRGLLIVDAERTIADKSAYTALVVREFKLFGGPNVVLRTNYDMTDVPVPDGIKGTGQPVTLAQ